MRMLAAITVPTNAASSAAIRISANALHIGRYTLGSQGILDSIDEPLIVFRLFFAVVADIVVTIFHVSAVAFAFVMDSAAAMMMMIVVVAIRSS